MSNLFDRVFQEIKDNKEKRDEGLDICIPWPSLTKLSSVIPGVQKARYQIVTANSKVGKTQLADFLFLYEPLDYILTHKTNIKLKIFYFSLEMSAEDKLLQMIVNKIFRDKKISISTDQIRAYFKDFKVTEEHLSWIEEYKEYFYKILEIVEFIDNTRNSYGIYKKARDWAIQNGKFYFKSKQVNPDELYDEYRENDPNLYTIIIVDHMSLIQPDKTEKDLWTAMFNFSSNFCLKLRDNFKFTVVGVQQQSADSEKQQFTFKGDSIVDKIRPSADGLGDCKLTGRDVDMMFGLFSPDRYKITDYEGYDISVLKDNYRELSVIFNRRGRATNLDLFFDGAVNYFKELPNPSSPDITKVYKYCEEKRKK